YNCWPVAHTHRRSTQSDHYGNAGWNRAAQPAPAGGVSCLWVRPMEGQYWHNAAIMHAKKADTTRRQAKHSIAFLHSRTYKPKSERRYFIPRISSCAYQLCRLIMGLKPGSSIGQRLLKGTPGAILACTTGKVECLNLLPGIFNELRQQI